MDSPLRSQGTSAGLSRERPGRSVCCARTARWRVTRADTSMPRMTPASMTLLRLPIACTPYNWQHGCKEKTGSRENRSRLLYRQRKGNMVERRIELKRRYHRKKKLHKLKGRLAKAKDAREKDNI